MRRSTVFAILACCIACLTLTAQETEPSREEKLKEAKEAVEQFSRARRDLLWILEDDPQAKQQAGYEELNAALAKCKIATSKEAGGAAVQFVLDEQSGISAQESIHTTGLLCLGRDVQGFGSTGDFVWIIQFVELLGTHKTAAAGVTQEFWVNAANGTVRAMLPLR